MTELPKIKIIGLTGMSGAGKSTVCRVFAESGFSVIDCDKAAHEVTQAGEPCVAELAKCLSREVVNDDGSLNRRVTGRMIFADESMRKKFNAVVYPYIRYNIIAKIKRLAESGCDVLLDAPTLFEARIEGICSTVLAVCADKERCAERIMLRDTISYEDALNRLNSQHDIEFFRQNADILIENNGTPEELFNTARAVAAELKGMA